MDPKYQYRCLSYFDIVLRFFEKLRIAHVGVPLKPEHMDYDANKVMDDVYPFFIFCHHIKDWIKNDDQIDPKVKDEVEDFVRNNACLRFCADIANGIKHLKLDRHQRSKSRPEIVKGQRKIISAEAITQDFIFFKTDDGEIEVFDLASECINKWTDFIKKNICKETIKPESV